MNLQARIAAEQIVTLIECGGTGSAAGQLQNELVDALGGLPHLLDNMEPAGIALYILALHLRKAT